jgi:hypothetical protein
MDVAFANDIWSDSAASPGVGLSCHRGSFRGTAAARLSFGRAVRGADKKRMLKSRCRRPHWHQRPRIIDSKRARGSIIEK